MAKKETQHYKLRVPSMMDIATIDNLNKFINILPKIPDTFENSNIIDIKEYPLNNENAISRVLSYFKYLGILIEERKKEKIGEKIVKKQFFHLTENGKKLKEIVIYDSDKISEIWSSILKDSELYKSLINNDDFKKWGYITKVTIRKLLDESFKSTVKDRKERVDKAETYLINFLTDSQLFRIDEDRLIPFDNIQKNEEDIDKSEGKGTEIDSDNEEENQDTGNGDFIPFITDDFKLKIKKSMLAVKMLEMQIPMIKLKIKTITGEKEIEDD